MAGRLGSLAACSACLLAAAPAPASAQPQAPRGTWSLASPSGAVTAAVTAGPHAVTLAVLRPGGDVLAVRVRSGTLPGLPLHGRRGGIDDAFVTPAGKRRRHVLQAATLLLRLGGGRRVQVLAADDGVAVRGLHVPAPVWHVPPDGRAWLQPYSRAYENPYAAATPATAFPGAYGFPALLRPVRGTWALLGESGLAPGQGASHLVLRASSPGALRVRGADPDPDPGWSPWRFAVLGRLRAIVGSDLPLSLGRPSRLPDASWVRPGRAAWSWWSDPASSAQPDRQRQYVDFAAAQGYEYVVVDAGWTPDEIPPLAADAAARGVRLVLWTDWRALADPGQRAALLDQWASWGVAGIKVDFLESDGRDRMAMYDAVAADAAARHLVVDFHGATVPRGIQRTWPNVLSVEAVRGAEHVRWGEPVDAANDVTLAFTRNVLGSMDYTPGAFSAPNRTVTLGHELAVAGVYESGLLTYADSPEAYAAYPAALAAMRELPAAWDDVRLLRGSPGRSVTLARRAGTTWWVASISAGAAAQRQVPLDFLAPGAPYTATVTGDDGAGGIASWTAAVGAGRRLTVGVPALGGFLIRLVPAG